MRAAGIRRIGDTAGLIDLPGPPGRSLMIWLQVRDVHAEHARLAAAGYQP